ncbi:MAG: CIA30 family protein [Planctomycetota bacterium]
MLNILIPALTLLTDFGSGGVPLRWTSVNDTVMGGRSRGSFRIEDGVLVFSGTLNTNGGGFASIRGDGAKLPLGKAEGIHLRVRGDGRVYTMRVRQGGRRSVSYRAKFETTKGEWQDIWLPLRAFVPSWRGRTLDLPPVDPSRIDGLGLMIADKIDGEFRLEVDSIQAYRPFSMDDYRSATRPLVLFAPRADDKHLLDQLKAMRADEAALRDRGIEIVVVLTDGVSRAGSRPLSKADVASLRKRFNVAPDQFALRLIGKDGGVKRSATRPVNAADLFDQIDKMPMRRAELAARQ